MYHKIDGTNVLWIVKQWWASFLRFISLATHNDWSTCLRSVEGPVLVCGSTLKSLEGMYILVFWLMNYNSIRRTAPATPGRFISNKLHVTFRRLQHFVIPFFSIRDVRNKWLITNGKGLGSWRENLKNKLKYSHVGLRACAIWKIRT